MNSGQVRVEHSRFAGLFSAPHSLEKPELVTHLGKLQFSFIGLTANKQAAKRRLVNH